MKKPLTLEQRIHRLEQSIAKFGDAHNTKKPILQKLKQQLKQTIDIQGTL